MNEKIKNHLTVYCEKYGWGTNDDTLREVLSEAKPIYKELVGEHRWYTDQFTVVNIDGMLIGFYDFYITGDNSASDMGLEINLNKVHEVVKKQKMVYYYEAVE